MRPVTVLLVAVGGVIGVLARYGLGTTVSASNAPWVVLAINVSGSFLLGALVPWSAHLSEPIRAGLMAGFCGGFTTFSTVSVQILVDARGGDAGFAALYLAASIAGGVAAAAVGFIAARALVQ